MRSTARIAGEAPISAALTALRELTLEIAIARDEPAALNRARDHRAHAMRIREGLLEIVEGAAAHTIDGALDGAVAGHHHHLDVGLRTLQQLEQVETAGRAEPHIEQHHVDLAVRE